MSDPILQLQNVKYSYPTGQTALAGIDLEVRQGERLAILGANASGKSTLLYLMGGLYFAASGSVTAMGKSLTESSLEEDSFRRTFRSSVQMVFQNSDAQLFCPTVEDEIAFGPLQLDIPRAEVQSRIKEYARLCSLEHLLKRPPHRLSGGEKKRVAIAAALAINPSVLLLDEPTASLDPRTERWLVEFLAQIHSQGKTLIIATHDLHLLPELADRAVVLSEEHKIVKVGTPHEVLSDLDLLLEVNLIHAHTHKHGVTTHSHPHIHGFSHEHDHETGDRDQEPGAGD
jgi:cobalt/nickel transport system ATP-binding protein